MNRIVQRGIFVLMALLAANHVSASSLENPLEIEIVYDWQEYQTIDGIKIEYKYQAFETGTFRNQLLILFRFSNESTETKTIIWSTEEFRNGICSNCSQIDSPEYSRSVTLSPGEVLEGTASDVTKTEEYLFSNFIKLVPGMTNQRLTDFNFVNVNISIL